MRKITSLLMLFCMCVCTAFAQNVFKTGARTTNLEVGKKYLIGAATFYNNARYNLLYNNNGILAYSDKKPGTAINDESYLFTVTNIDANGFVYITNNQGGYLQDNSLSDSKINEYGMKVVPYASVKGTMTCGNDVQACDEKGNKIEYNNITKETPIVCVYNGTAPNGWRYIQGLEVGRPTPFAFYEVEYPYELPELTTDPANPIWYTIKNKRGNAYAAYDGDGESIKLRPTVESAASLFYFTKGDTEGTYKINTFANNLKCAATNSWTEEGIDWYIKESACENPIGLTISKDATLTADGSEAWNDFQNNHTSVDWYGGDDAGSVWAIEKYEGAVPGIQLSTANDIKLHYIRSIRRNSYVNFDGHNSTFKEGEKGLNSYWYFVQDAEAQANAPEGFIACKIFNAAHATGVENFTTGYMEDSSWPAKVFYIGLRENDRYGYVIHLPGDGNGWHDFGGTHIGSYGLGDNGSLWRIYPSEKTPAQLKSEATTALTNANSYISIAEAADFYTYTDEAIATAKSTIESMSVSDLASAVNVLKNAQSTLDELKATEKGTTAPVAGQYIQLKNKQYNTYLKDNGTNLHGVNNKSDFATLWLVVAGTTEGAVKLQNASTGKFIGDIATSANVAMVGEADAKEFVFENPTDIYGAFKETDGGGYDYGHIAGHNVLVGWEKGADASQWLLSEETVKEALDELKAIYDVVDNAFGDQPGQYKQAMEEVDNAIYVTVEGVVKPMLESEADDVDVYIAKTTAADLKAKWDAVKNTVREINAPAQGKFYRLKNVASGNYMCGNATNVNLKKDGSSLHTTIFYLGENNTLLSYNSGLYLDCAAKDYSPVGTGKSGAFEMAYGGAQANVITYKNNSYYTYGAGADGGSLDRGSSTPNHAGYNWELEEVTWLPIPVNEEAGWTSLYSPVELALSSNRFKAYTVSAVSEEYATLEEQTVVPAGVGVVLELQEGAQMDNGCVYLQIKATETTGVTSELLGTYADEYIAKDAYVLSMVDGEVGLYTAKLNQQENTAFLNNGFKAYLPMPAGSNVQALRFNFGGETTAIETVETENTNAPIYDLSGRRVLSTVKGGIYIQNGKKFIVK